MDWLSYLLNKGGVVLEVYFNTEAPALLER